MFNGNEIWFTLLWFAFLLVGLYWWVCSTRGRFVARVVTAVMLPQLFMFIFAERLIDLLGDWQWLLLLVSMITAATTFTYWFSNKYGKRPQKQ
jgi:CDP-diglyceride synthetase